MSGKRGKARIGGGRTSRAVPAGAAGSRPLVAIVGRPNVGKSTLFNTLAGQRIAIVEDRPGVTRDRHYADAHAFGHDYVLIDTGGFDPESDDPMKAGITSAVKLALEECDLVICVFDATTDPTSADREAVALLRQAGKPVLYVANKADTEKRAHAGMGHYELGIDRIFPVSALHNRGVGDLEEAIARSLPESSGEAIELGDEAPRIAIVGRPNAGKSSLVNQLVGEARQIVDDRPGTTVDAIDTLMEKNGQHAVLIDTAGIRRRRAVGNEGLEALSVYQAIRAIERSDVVVLMIDASEGVGEQDAKIAGLVDDRGRGLIIALNKSDLMKPAELEKAMDRTREVLAFAPWAPMVTISAKTGKGVKQLLDRVFDAVVEHRRRIGTAEINRFFEEVLERHPPPSMRSHPVRIFYVTQAQVKPPTFVVVANRPENVHFSYQRYVVNQIRERFGFRGTPLRVRYRAKSRKDREG